MRFAQSRLRHALQQRLAPESRKRLHCQIDTALEKSYPKDLAKSAALAYNCRQADDPAQALIHALRDGELVLRLHAHSEARQHFGAALWALEQMPDLPDTSRILINVLVQLTRASLLSDWPERNLARLQPAEKLFNSFADLRKSVGEDQLVLAWIKYLMGRILYLASDYRQDLQWYQELRPIAQASADPALLALSSLGPGSVGTGACREKSLAHR